MTDLWVSSARSEWRNALARYDHVVTAQGVARLVELDTWSRSELPDIIASRRTPHAS